MRKIAEWILKLFGWDLRPFTPTEKKYVVIVAPHTSFWDFFVGKLFCVARNIPAKFFIKKEFFFFPIRRALRAIGGIPIDRKHATNVVAYSVELFNKTDDLVIIITPEGTRKRVNKWKKGYYFIAERASVPLYAGFIDYKKKTCGIIKQISVTGNYEEDFKHIEQIYRGMSGKRPKRFNLYP
ncbi:MAG: 1-acyl-sn-glycerol-3-phosphate acyltransferase [Bacteroidales bacterium]|jgi:1-acyl-sn-glycerol-3-phosphate acyltransferase|nr:1-acyl-sn-glycerol-3-phosphate acyltransferase [Bacteroidales bacterium]